MIFYLKVDIFEAKVNILSQFCNCYCKQGAGLASEIRKRYPAAYEADLKTKAGDKSKLGTFSWAQIRPDFYVTNLYTQYYYGNEGRFTDYEAVYCSLMQLCQFALVRNASIALPYNVGCGLGGGDWKIVKAMIESIFGNSTVKVIICQKPS